MNKICTRCKKMTNDFSRDKRRKDKLQSHCRKCQYKWRSKHLKTKEGLLCRIYSQQKTTSKQRGYPLPTYSKKELFDWVFSQEIFDSIYNKWKDSGYCVDLVPSLDRIDSYKSYTLDNIQIVTWEQNRKNYYSDCKNGINNKQANKVYQYDLDGNFIQEYYSTREASRRTKCNFGNISNNCSGRYKKSGGFIWKWNKT